MTRSKHQSHQVFSAKNQVELQKHLDLVECQHGTVRDVYQDQRHELFFATDPSLTESDWLAHWEGSEAAATQGSYVYYPWKRELVHVLDKEEYYQLRTNRNFPLITHSHQKKLSDLTIGIVGLSVGSHVATALAHSGIGKHFKLADPDTLSLSNINRMYESVSNIGQNKAVLLTRKLAELDPHLQLDTYDDGLHRNTFAQFFNQGTSLDLIIDECDDLVLKLYLRLAARALQIPLLMVTDNGYTVDVSVLDFSSEQKNSFSEFPPLTFEDVVMAYQVCEQPTFTIQEQNNIIFELLGKDGVTEEMKQSMQLREEGKLASWPQLGMVAAAGGGIGAYIASILVDGRLPNKDKFSINLSEFFLGLK